MASKRKMQNQQVIVDAPIGKGQEEATTSRGKKSKLDADIDMFPDPELKMEVYVDEDYNVNPIQSTVKHKHKSTINKSDKGKKQRKKPTLVTKYPRRNSTKATNKFRLNYKAMFDPSIKKEKLIVIEDNFEGSKTCIKEQKYIPPFQRNEKENKNLGKTQGKGKKVDQYSTRPITRETTRSSKAEAMFKGTGGVFDDKDYHSIYPDQIPNLQDARDSDSSDDDHSSELSSSYQIKLRKPRAAIDLNKPTPAEEFPAFKVKVGSDKDKIKDLQKMVKQLKKEND
jgi:hypothetical protein